MPEAAPDTPVEEFARVFKAQQRIEECFRRAKGAAGLADYQVRTWEGWHHHQTLALLATWFLTQEARRGKNPDPCVDGPTGAACPGRHPPPSAAPSASARQPAPPPP